MESPQIPGVSPSREIHLSQLCTSLEQLDEHERILLNLRYWRGLSIGDISEIVSKSETAIRKRLERARQHLREKMQDEAAA